MVNVHIHEYEPGSVLDASALHQFQKQWATYQKMVDANSLRHREAGAILRGAIEAEFARPFAFLDIACGDASMVARTLAGTQAAHYHGIDLAEPAIELAAKNLDGAAFEVDLDHGDFVEALSARPEPADLAWCGFSIHHLQTDEKRRFLASVRAVTRGAFLMFEPARKEGESRDGFLDRFILVNRQLWTELNEEEWDQIEAHVTSCDFPETASGWLDLGREAGFRQSRELYVDPNAFFRLYRYDP